MTPDTDLTDPLTYVVCAANRHKRNGLILCGARHFDLIMHAMIRRLAELNTASGSDIARFDWADSEQGFIDNRGQWLTREKAWIIAEKAGQIRNPNVSCGVKGTLFSENLY